MGIGLNVTTEAFPAELKTPPRCAPPRRGASARAARLAALIESLADGCTSPRPRCSPPGAPVTSWGEPVAGKAATGAAAGIDDSGALIVETAEGPVALDAGEVHLQR